MKKKYRFILLIALIRFSELFSQSIFFSEYLEGSSNNKAIEIYNPTQDTINLSKSQYVIQIFANGNTNATSTIILSGSILPKSTFVIAHNSFSLAAPSGTINQNSGSLTFNGDDAVTLKIGGANGKTLDVIGQIGFRPTGPAAWVGANGTISTLDMTLLRKLNTTFGDTISNDVFDPSTQWTSLSLDNVSNLGHYDEAIPFGIHFSPQKLSFTLFSNISETPALGYLISYSNTLQNLNVSCDSNFKIATSKTGPFLSSLIINQPSLISGDSIFVKFNPIETNLKHLTSRISHITDTNILYFPIEGFRLDSITPINTIQGKGSRSHMIGQKIVTNGVVTMDLQKQEEQRGFYMQGTTDNDSNTSDGIFVFADNSAYEVSPGDYIQVEGFVDEYYGQTELKDISSIIFLDKTLKPNLDTALIVFPADSIHLESAEGMLCNFLDTMVVTENYNLGRYGELSLSPKCRLYNPTEIYDLNDSLTEGYNYDGLDYINHIIDAQKTNDMSRIILCDNVSVQNPNPIPFIDPSNHTIRSGSKIPKLKGIMGYGFDSYRIYTSANPDFEYAPRPLTPKIPDANLLVCSFNVLNYFNGDGNRSGFPTSRGAKTWQEYTRQKSKIIAALKDLNADIFGLIEIENDGQSHNPALNELTDSLNQATLGTYKYDFVSDPPTTLGNPGSDEIKVALIYKSSVVSPVGYARYLNHMAFDNLGRPPLLQVFRHLTTGELFHIIVNHFKSKGCTNATGFNNDKYDGQGCYNYQRLWQAQALASWIDSLGKTEGGDKIISLGDYNSYSEEDPMDFLKSVGLTKLPNTDYSYVFNGQSGALDHTFISKGLTKYLIKSQTWHINADEPNAIDYTLTYKTQDLYQASPFRSSDHDPVITGFRFSPIVTDSYGQSSIQNPKDPVHFSHSTLIFKEPTSGKIYTTTGHVISEFQNIVELQTKYFNPGLYIIKTDKGTQTRLIMP